MDHHIGAISVDEFFFVDFFSLPVATALRDGLGAPLWAEGGQGSWAVGTMPPPVTGGGEDNSHSAARVISRIHHFARRIDTFSFKFGTSQLISSPSY